MKSCCPVGGVGGWMPIYFGVKYFQCFDPTIDISSMIKIRETSEKVTVLMFCSRNLVAVQRRTGL